MQAFSLCIKMVLSIHLEIRGLIRKCQSFFFDYIKAFVPWYPEYGEFELTLDHSYVFEVTKNVKVDNNTTISKVPLVVGEIVNPNYKE